VEKTRKVHKTLVRKHIAKQQPGFSRSFAKTTEMNVKKLGFDNGKWGG
jgi:hypothetical protein